MRHAGIISTGSFLPERSISNEDLQQFPAVALPLIAEKTGIRMRRHADVNVCTSDLAAAAAARCLAKAGFPAERVDAIVLATSSPDRFQPATATAVQQGLGAVNAFAFDINSACSGAVYGLALADALVKSGQCEHVLVIAADLYSKYLNPDDFSTYPYFGDGAGAVLIGPVAEGRGIQSTLLGSDGAGADVIQVPGGGTRLPYSKMEKPEDAYFTMKGRQVYSFAVSKGPEVVGELLRRCGATVDDVKLLVAHQANINILREVAASLGIGMEKVAVNLDRYGNTAAASVLIALDEAVDSGSLRPGDKLVLLAFGGGLSWGASLIIY